MNIYSALKEANKTLKKNNIRSALLDSEILLSKVIKQDRKYIILNYNKSLTNEKYNIFKSLIKDLNILYFSLVRLLL